MHFLKPITLGAALLVGGGAAVSLLGGGGGAADVEKVRAAAARCTYFPANSFYKADVSRLPRDPRSSAYVKSIGVGRRLKADFGSGTWEGRPFGIPITGVPAGTPKVKVKFSSWGARESEKGPYAIPRNAKVEGGRKYDGDRHVLAVDTKACVSYELFHAFPQPNGTWKADSGAIFNLRSNKLRPAGWTSADAAGLSIAAPLVKVEEVRRGSIPHVLRITIPRIRNTYIWPARHKVNNNKSTALPPMGAWLRLKPGVNISRYPKDARVILQALKTHGAIVADIGSAWYITGTQDSRWNNNALQALGGIKGTDLEFVNAAGLMVSRNSGEIKH